MTGNTVTCHGAPTSCQEAPPGAWGVEIHSTAGTKVDIKMLQQVVPCGTPNATMMATLLVAWWPGQ
jgi:hypothetical protein